jgi:hypothetical protein
MSYIYTSCHSTGSKQRGGSVERLFKGTISPCEKAYLDIFVLDTGIDKNLVSLCNTPAEREYEKEDLSKERPYIHKVLYNGYEVWRADPNLASSVMAVEDNDEDDILNRNRSNKNPYKSTCVLLQDPQQVELTIESTLPAVASDEEVQDEIAAAPTSVWCNTSTGYHYTSSTTAATSDSGVVIFRGSRKINVESLIRASAEAYQRLTAAAIVPEREAKVLEYCFVKVPDEYIADIEMRDDCKDKHDNEIGQIKSNKDRKDQDVLVVVKPSVSMASDSSSVYLNQEDDELSAQQQEMVRSFGGVGCFVNGA